MTTDPLDQFSAWLQAAKKSGLAEPTAMALATADATGAPSVRMVLLKGADPRGFVFYTNLGSPKASDLAANPKAELCFYWPPDRQVRVRGTVAPTSAEEADAYFASRPRLSQLGAWASRQSQPLGGYAELERAVIACVARFGPAPSPVRISGPDSGSCPRRSNFGSSAPSDCTAGCGSHEARRVGINRPFIPDRIMPGRVGRTHLVIY